MLSADQTLLQLADPTARPALLSSDELLQIAITGYDIDADTVVGPTTAVYDQVLLAISISRNTTAVGHWGKPTDAVQTDGVVTLSGLTPPTPGADAVWIGSVVVRVGSGSGVITAADVTDSGRTPDGSDHLAVAVAFSAPPAVTENTAPTILPVIVAFLVADANFSPRDLLQRSEFARAAAARFATTAAPKGAPDVRFERVVCWVVPEAAFDDAGWPGTAGGTAAQQRAARIAAARLWLTDQGIALVTTTAPAPPPG